MKKLLPLFLILLVSFCGFSQNKMIDNVKNHLKTKNPNDSTKVRAYYTLAQQYASFSNDSLILYTNKALALSVKTNNYLLPHIYNYKGIEYLMKSKPDSARIYLSKALSVLDDIKDLEVKANVYQNFSNSYQSTGEFEKRIDYLLKSIDLLEDNPYNQCVSYYNVGALYNKLKIPSQSLKYFRKSYETSIKGKNINIENAALTSLGTTYMGLKKLDSAQIFLEKSLAITKNTNSSLNYYETYSKLGGLYGRMKLYTKAEDAYLKASKYADMLGDEKSIMRTNASLADYYLNKKNYKKAINYYEKYNKLYEENPNSDLNLIHFVYKNWARAEGNIGNAKKSSELLDKYLKIQDSIYSKENRAIVSDAETKYQSAKKDKEIAEQELVLVDQNLKLTESKSKTRIMSILIVSLLVASILLWFLFQQRQKSIQQQLVTIKREQEVRTLESLMEGEEKERFRIAKELHDGVNGDLSAIKFKLSSLLEMNNTVIKEAVAMIDNSCEQVRAISHNLVPPSLKNFSLLEAVDEYCQSMNSIHDPEVNFQQVGDSINLDKKQEANLFRIIQELVTNSIKHAEAEEINVQLSHLENTLQLTVEDNGKGFDPKTVKSDGIGMQNVQSRIDYLNATMDFISNEKGTSYTIAMDTKNKEA